MEDKKKIKGHLTAFITIFIWGTTYISTKVLLQYFEPVEILFIRFIMGYLTLWLVCPKLMKSKKEHEIYFMFAGITGITFYYLLENIALVYTQATNVGVIISIAPFFTAILSHFFCGEKLNRYFFIGFLTAIMGICLISYNGSTSFRLNPFGDILAVLAAFIWALYSIITRKLSEFGYPTVQSTRKTFLYGLIFMLPALYLLGYHPDYNKLYRPIVLWNILFLGLGASALCFVTWNLAVRLLGAVKTSVYIYMVPVITVTTSVLILSEKINLISVCGILLTLVGLFLSYKKL